jgi:hypothetical protein
MNMEMFSAPSTPTTGVKVADLEGKLLVIEPTDFKTEIPTVHGVADAIQVNLLDVDSGTRHNDVLFFNVALKSALIPKIGQKVLARIGKGVAKPGKSAPWILIDASTEAGAVAKAQAALGASQPAVPAAKATTTSEVLTPEIAELLKKLGAQPVE